MMAILEATTKKSSTKVISKRALQKNPSIRALQKKYVLFLSTCKKFRHTEFAVQIIPNGCLDAYEVKVNIDIFKYQEKVKLISQFQRFFTFSNGL